MMAFFASTDWAVVLATIVGPIAAVAISIWLDRQARQRERRLSVINSMIHGWTMAPLAWNQAMLQVPLEFGKKDAVMERWADCNKAAAEQRMSPDLRDALIKAAMKVVGFSDRLAGEAVRAMYRTTAVVELETIQRNALTALPNIATAAARSADAAEAMLDIIRKSGGQGNPA